MTAHVNKNTLGLMLPGTTNHYFQSEPQYLDAPRPGMLALVVGAVAGWFARRNERAVLAELSDAQLADIGVTRADAPMLFDRGFAARRDHDRIIAMLQSGRVAGI